MLRAVAREATASARSQRVPSIVSVLVIAAMCLAVLLTSGRTVGAQRDVVASIDSAGTRAIVVQAQPDSGLDTTVVDRIAALRDVAWIGAFGPATDVTNTAVPGGTRVPTRTVLTTDPTVLGLGPHPERTGISPAYGSPAALDQLGALAPTGSVSSKDGAEHTLAGQLNVPDYLRQLEPLLLLPTTATASDPNPVSVLVIIATEPTQVAVLTALVTPLLAIADPTTASITTSEAFSTLRGLVDTQLGTVARTLLLGVLLGSGVIVSCVLYGFILLRRKDYGRRRALGASQRLIVTLVLTQALILSTLGAAIGTASGIVTLLITNDPLPGPAFTTATAVLATTVGTAAALLPAVSAARRDPLRELRVP